MEGLASVLAQRARSECARWTRAIEACPAIPFMTNAASLRREGARPTGTEPVLAGSGWAGEIDHFDQPLPINSDRKMLLNAER